MALVMTVKKTELVKIGDVILKIDFKKRRLLILECSREIPIKRINEAQYDETKQTKTTITKGEPNVS